MSDAGITLACLDMAGTTVADGGLVEAAFIDAITDIGVGEDDERRPGMLEYVRDTMGTSKIVVFRALFGNEFDAQRANDAFEAAYDRRCQAGTVSPIEGAADAIDRLRRGGVKVALLTGFSATTRDRLVRALGWQDIADLFVCPAEAGRGRPYPDMVLHSLLQLEIDSVSSVAVLGDTAADIESGLRSGASIVAGVRTGSDGEDRLRSAGATHVLGSVAELPELLGF